jgi:hypothetical protein
MLTGRKALHREERRRVEAEVVCPKHHGNAQITLVAKKTQLCHKKEPRSYAVCGAWGS